ncbi:hypothetical protein M9434_005112 [Picochlorum sp. BPE23]|nr:hypothetical protein M9434_005112 [Picochlorum sp. BPE23]|mmetsp:Transcript_12202/g.24533  ORF Transcript_12202/g.24533 Transcript_12202/m.24533 type:complete len:145 (-) Transcript_12202:111-545(-)
MKFISFEDPESTILSLSALSGATCGAVNLFAPNEGHDMFFEEATPKNPSCTRWLGHAVTSTAIMTASHNTEDHTVCAKKDTLKALSVVHGSMAGLMAYDLYKEDVKKPLAIGHICLHAGLATACLVRGFAKDKEEKEDVPEKKK